MAIVINPSSGGGRTLRLWPEIGKKLLADGYVLTSHTSLSEADFRNQIRAYARSFRRLAVCGGDSSLTMAAEELLKIKYRGELVFFPAGSVNDIVLDIREQAQDKKKTIYLGNVSAGLSEKKFIGQANWGLGVIVNRWVRNVLQVFPFLRPLQNLIGFFSILVAHLLRRELVRCSIDADGQRISGEYSIVLVSQIRHWASGLRFCPGANFLSPKFQIVLVERCNLFILIRIILAAKTGRHLAFPQVKSYPARRVKVQFSKPQCVQIDGDILTVSGNEYARSDYALSKNKSAFLLSGNH